MKKRCSLLPLILLNLIMDLPYILTVLLRGSLIMLLGKLTKCETTSQYGWNLLESIDQYGNTIIGGDIDETISSRAGKRQHDSKLAKTLCWLLDLVDPDHCNKAIEKDEGKDKILD